MDTKLPPQPSAGGRAQRGGMDQTMSPYLRYHPEPVEGPCSLCGRPTVAAAGLQLCQVETGFPVCPCCARKAAPALAALLNLAGPAERVGRITQHAVRPPLAALLGLARAAESFTALIPAPCAAAA